MFMNFLRRLFGGSEEITSTNTHNETKVVLEKTTPAVKVNPTPSMPNKIYVSRQPYTPTRTTTKSTTGGSRSYVDTDGGYDGGGSYSGGSDCGGSDGGGCGGGGD